MPSLFFTQASVSIDADVSSIATKSVEGRSAESGGWIYICK